MRNTTRLKKPQVPELEQLYLFDELGGRPKYGNEEMTSETDIPSFDSIMDDTHSAVVAETSARVLADRALQDEIDIIKAASDVVDIVGTYADLQAYDTSKLNDNDIIKVLEDETHDDKMSYYRWSTSAEAFSYIGSEIPVEVLQTTGTSTTAVMSQNAVTENLDERAFKVLTSEDANYPVNNPIGIAPWLLDDGAYIIKSAYVYKQYGNSNISVELAHLFVTHWDTNPTAGRYTKCWTITPNIVTNNTAVKNIVVGGAKFDGSWHSDLNARGIGRSDGDTLLAVDMITSLSLDSPSSSESYRPATATAIRNLINGSIDKKVITGTPDIYLRGTVGQLLEDTTNGKLYICTAVNPQGTTPESYTYTWEEVAISTSIPSVVQTTGTSTTDVMSQDGVSKLLFAKYSGNYNNHLIKIGSYNGLVGYDSIVVGSSIGLTDNGNLSWSTAIGSATKIKSDVASAFGYSAQATKSGSVAIGPFSSATTVGEMNIGSTNTTYGYNSTNYRLLSGLHDPQNAHDAATKGYVDTAVAGAGAATINSTDWSALWQ